jgi:putative membrane protein
VRDTTLLLYHSSLTELPQSPSIVLGHPFFKGIPMKHALVIATCIAMSGPAMAQSIGEKTGVDALLGITPSTADFVLEVARSDMFELASSKIAVEKTDGAIRSFASMMIVDHTKTTDQLKSEAEADNLPLPTSMSSANQSKLDKLAKLSGGDFAKEYMDEQVSAHKDAVNLFQRYGKGGDNSKLKNWAVTTLPTLQHHLDMAQDLDK